MNELCEWPIDYSSCTSCDVISELPVEEQQKFERMAAEYLWNWTDRLFGVCEETIRPCTSNCAGARAYTETFWGRGPFPWMGSADSGTWVPVLLGGKWFNLTCGCIDNCRCDLEGPTSLALPGPVQSITSVRVDGVLLDPSAYRVMYNRFLVRADGGTWPACQDLLALPTEEGTFEVIYKRGVPVPIGGQIAAAVLASEYAKAACNDRGCQLPKRIQSIVRQEVTITLMDDFKSLQEGGTGIWMIDGWVQSLRKPARPMAGVRSVDVRPSGVGRRGY